MYSKIEVQDIFRSTKSEKDLKLFCKWVNLLRQLGLQPAMSVYTLEEFVEELSNAKTWEQLTLFCKWITMLTWCNLQVKDSIFKALANRRFCEIENLDSHE